MFKNGITLLVIAAAASFVSTEAALDKAHTIPSNPIVKKVTRSHGKISLTLDDGTVIHTKEHVHALDKEHTIPSNPIVKKVTRSHGKISLTLDDGTVIHTKEHVHATKVHGKESEGVVDGEVIHKYANGVVKIASKKQPVQSKQVKKKVAPPYKQVEAEGEQDETSEGQDEQDETSEGQDEQDENIEVEAEEGSVNGVKVDEVDEEENQAEGSQGSLEGGEVTQAPENTHDSADVDLESGESVSLTFGDHNVTLTLLQNGTLQLEADDTVQYLPAADDVTVEFDGSADFEESDDGTDAKHKKIAAKVVHKKAAVVGNHKVVQNDKKEVGFVEGIENKVTEFVTQLKGDSEYFTKKSTPFLIGCGLVGALAIVVGIAAVAVGRARDNAAAAADPQSVLAENEEDEDLEAATSTADADADDSESLSDAEAEEGKFANEVVVSV